MSAVRHYQADVFYYGLHHYCVDIANVFTGQEKWPGAPTMFAVHVHSRGEAVAIPPSLAADICSAITRAAETAAKWNAEDAALKAGPQ